MTKEQILHNIKEALASEKPSGSRNPMGVSESFYNPYFMVGKCFKPWELEILDSTELNRIIKLARYAAETFY